MSSIKLNCIIDTHEGLKCCKYLLFLFWSLHGVIGFSVISIDCDSFCDGCTCYISCCAFNYPLHFFESRKQFVAKMSAKAAYN